MYDFLKKGRQKNQNSLYCLMPTLKGKQMLRILIDLIRRIRPFRTKGLAYVPIRKD